MEINSIHQEVCHLVYEWTSYGYGLLTVQQFTLKHFKTRYEVSEECLLWIANLAGAMWHECKYLEQIKLCCESETGSSDTNME